MRIRVVLAFLYFLSGLTVSQAQDNLQNRLNNLIEESLPPTSEVGIVVYDLTDGEQLYAYREHKLCRPASNMKTLTVITALAQPDTVEPFNTDVWYKGVIERDTLMGDLYIIGGFDPEFGDNEMDTLVAIVSSLPFTAIKGNVYGDVSMKDSMYWGNGWAWDDNPASFQPYLSPLMFHKGMVRVTATPRRTRGEPASLLCQPVSSFYTLTNETQTKTPAAGDYSVSRNWLENKNDIVVKGNVHNMRVGEVNMQNSQDFFLHTFIERLRQKGIAVESTYEYREFAHDETAMHIARISCPLQQVIHPLMKKSDNLNAEALLCKLAAQSTGRRKVSAQDGLAVINSLIYELGHDPDNYRLADGSGISNYNYLSPALLLDFLKYAYSQPHIFQPLYESLPISGVDGTLEYRMRKGSVAYQKVRAKTGSFTGICTLAGYLTTRKGHLLAFAIMNQNAMSLSKAREFQNKVCELLCKE